MDVAENGYSLETLFYVSKVYWPEIHMMLKLTRLHTQHFIMIASNGNVAVVYCFIFRIEALHFCKIEMPVSRYIKKQLNL